MIKPIIAEKIAAIRTAPAEISLALRASSFFSGLTRFTTVSKAVLKSSAIITSPKQHRQAIHSTMEI